MSSRAENFIPWDRAHSSFEQKTIGEIEVVRLAFNSCVVCTTAARAVAEEMLRSKLHYVDSFGTVDFKTPTPYYLSRVVREIIDSVMQVGFFAYRIVQRGKKRGKDDDLSSEDDTVNAIIDDGVRIEIAPVGSVYPVVEDASTGLFGVKNVPGFYPTDDFAWIGIFVKTPVFSLLPSVSVIRSSTADALKLIEQYNAIYSNFLHRDNLNSHNSVYTTINPNLSNVNGGPQTWFTGRTHDADASLAPQISRVGDFQEVIRSRAETIRALDHETSMLRQDSDADNPLAEHDYLTPETAFGGKRHVEHIISDGKNINECRPLQSLANAAHHNDRLETAIMFAMGFVFSFFSFFFCVFFVHFFFWRCCCSRLQCA